MGRFYTTDKSDFLQDFIYQPPWELIQQNNMLKAANYDRQQKTLNLFRNVDIKYNDEVDKEPTLAKKQEYDNSINAISKLYETDPNSTEADEMLRQATRKLKEDFTVGDIYKIQKNKEKYDEFKSIADTIEDPVDKATFERQYNNYLQANEDGTKNNALSKQFDFLKPQKRIDTNEFYTSDSFKQLKATQEAIARAVASQGYITERQETEKKLTEDRIEQAFRGWLKSKGVDNDDWKKYHKEVGGMNNLVDEKGDIRYDKGSYIGDMVDASKAYAWGEQTATETMKEDHTARDWARIRLEEEQLALQKKQAEEAVKALQAQQPTVTDTTANFFFRYTAPGQKLVRERIAATRDLAKSLGAKDDKQVNEIIQTIKNNPKKYPKQFKKLQEINTRFNAEMKAGTGYLAQERFDPKVIDAITTTLNDENFAKRFIASPLFINMGEVNGVQHTNEGASKGKTVYADSYVGRTFNTGRFKGKGKVVKVETVPNNFSAFKGGKNADSFGVKGLLKFTFAKGKHKEDVYVDAYTAEEIATHY